jgi:hypothetical protein
VDKSSDRADPLGDLAELNAGGSPTSGGFRSARCANEAGA